MTILRIHVSFSNGTIIGSLYFLFYMGLSSWLPFFNLYLKDLGYSGTLIGIIAAIFQAMLFFVVPTWGIISDRKGTLPILRIALLGSIILLWSMQYISTPALFIVFMLFLAFFHHPLGSLLDSLTLHYIYTEQRSSFGHLRVWGSLGWAIGTTVMGWVLLTRDMVIIFIVAALIYIFILAGTRLVRLPESTQPVLPDTNSKVALRLFSQKHIVVFLILLTLLGTGLAPIYVFINLYYRDIGASNQMVGFAFAIQALSEIPFFFLGRRLLKRFKSPNLLLAVVTVAVIRLLLYGFISTPIIAVMMGVLQGFTLSLFWVSATDFMQLIIPREWRSTGQSLIWAFHAGAGVTVGNLLIGRLSDMISMQQIMFLGSGFTFILLMVMRAYFHKHSPNT